MSDRSRSDAQPFCLAGGEGLRCVFVSQRNVLKINALI